MAYKLNLLSARKVNSLVGPGLYADGGNLYLQVNSKTAKSWVFRFRFRGKRRHMGMGSLNSLPLKEARQLASDYRLLVQSGINPLDERAAQRADENVIQFSECAEDFIKDQKAGWKNERSAAQWKSSLAQYAYPLIGNLPVQEVTTDHVYKILSPIWHTKTETANRLRGRIENILDRATVLNLRTGENPARWRGHMDKLFPKTSKVRQVSHHPALPYSEIANFLEDLRQRTGMSARALEFIILTAARTSEVLGARWAEINLQEAIWLIPAERMKNGQDHRVPLSRDALKLLARVQTGYSDYVFPSDKFTKPLSNMACLALLKRMDRKDITVHGFRSTFRDWAAEETSFSREVAEKALAHSLRSKVEAAYQREDLLEKRRALMEAWANHCSNETGRNEKVIRIRAA